MLNKLRDCWKILRNKHRLVMVFNHPFDIVISKVLLDGHDVTEWYLQTQGGVGLVHRDDSHRQDKEA